MYERTVCERYGSLVNLLRYCISSAVSMASEFRQSNNDLACSAREDDEVNTSMASSDISAGVMPVNLPVLSYSGVDNKIDMNTMSLSFLFDTGCVLWDEAAVTTVLSSPIATSAGMVPALNVPFNEPSWNFFCFYMTVDLLF